MLKKSVFQASLVVIFALSFVLFYSNADAVQGQCSNCHTMHNSQNNAPMAFDGDGLPQADPNQMLLRAGCVACHTADTGQTSFAGAPAVLHLTEPSGQGNGNTNAGGDFHWVVNTDQNRGHNVADLGVSSDSNIGLTPPGWDANATSSFTFGQVAAGAGSWGSQLTCAGTYGCHGRHDVDGSFPGIKGAHHTNPGLGGTQASTADAVGNSFRFLAGIKGLEDSNWNWNESTSQHNEYYGVNTQSNRQYDAVTTSYASRDTISFLCAECHGIFHSKIADTSAGGSPWRRHPTDITLPNSSEYAAYTTYNPQAPVARNSVVSSSSSVVAPGSDIVVCVSCHRAHGSNQPDLLRWDYADMQAGQGFGNTGCFTCHTTKDDLL